MWRIASHHPASVAFSRFNAPWHVPLVTDVFPEGWISLLTVSVVRAQPVFRRLSVCCRAILGGGGVLRVSHTMMFDERPKKALDRNSEIGKSSIRDNRV